MFTGDYSPIINNGLSIGLSTGTFYCAELRLLSSFFLLWLSQRTHLGEPKCIVIYFHQNEYASLFSCGCCISGIVGAEMYFTRFVCGTSNFYPLKCADADLMIKHLFDLPQADSCDQAIALDSEMGRTTLTWWFTGVCKWLNQFLRWMLPTATYCTQVLVVGWKHLLCITEMKEK